MPGVLDRGPGSCFQPLETHLEMTDVGLEIAVAALELGLGEADHRLGFGKFPADFLPQASNASLQDCERLGERLHSLGDRLHFAADAFGHHLEVALDLVHGLPIHAQVLTRTPARGGPRRVSGGLSEDITRVTS